MTEFKMVPRSLIHIDPDLSKAMPVKPRLVDKLVDSMAKEGFRQECPVVVMRQGTTYVFLDGRNRIAASIRTGIDPIPVAIRPDITRVKEVRKYVLLISA